MQRQIKTGVGLFALVTMISGTTQAETKVTTPEPPPQTSAKGSPIALSLERAIDMAKGFNPDIKIRSNEIERTEWQKRQALGTALPQISSEVSWQHYPSPPMMGGIPVKRNYETVGSITVRQAIFTFGAVSNALKAAEVGLKASRYSKDATVREVIYATRLAYYSVLLAAQQLEIAKDSLKNAEDNLRILRQAVYAGRPGQSDFLRIQSDVNSRRPRVEEAQANYDQAVYTLKRIVGLEPDQDITLTTALTTEFPTFDAASLKDKLLSNQPQLAALESAISLNENIAKVQRSRGLPSIGAFYNYSQTRASDSSRPGAGDPVDSSAVGIALQWNIWDGGSTNAEYKQALVDKTNAEITLRKTRDDLILSLDRALASYRAQRESFQSNERAVDFAKRSFQISQKRFRAGQTSVTELNDVEGLLTQNRLQAALSQFQLNQSIAEVERLTAPREEATP